MQIGHGVDYRVKTSHYVFKLFKYSAIIKIIIAVRTQGYHTLSTKSIFVHDYERVGGNNMI